MSALDQLLDVQAHDTRIDQLRHRHATLAERDRLVALATERQAIDREVAELGRQRDELGREQRRLEDEVSRVEDKRRSVDQAMYSGSVSNPRELQAMQDDVASLGRRQSQLEDQVLDLMERTEPVTSRLADLAAATAANAAAADEVTADLRRAEAEIDDELRRETAVRADSVAGVDAELVAEYESLRSRGGGIGIARLVGGQCGGCHLTLSAVDLARIKKLPPDAVAHCEECGRLLAR